MKANATRDFWTESSKPPSFKALIDMTKGDAAETIKDIIFPQRCPVCGDAIPIERRINVRNLKRNRQQFKKDEKAFLRMLYPAYVCRECISELSYISKPYCKKCGKQLSKIFPLNQKNNDHTAGDEKLCTDCTKKERLFIQSRAILNYDETAREIMAGLKYKSKSEYAGLLSLLAAERLYYWIMEIRPDFIVPVPIHKERLIKRGYNQAELIGKGISELTGIPQRTDILYRIKNTKAQKELTAEERLLNLQNSFIADKRTIRHILNALTYLKSDSISINRIIEMHGDLHQAETAELNRQINIASDNRGELKVLLIDDIYTTGSTMEACTEALLRAGVSSVYGICICAGMDTPRIDVRQKH